MVRLPEGVRNKCKVRVEKPDVAVEPEASFGIVARLFFKWSGAPRRELRWCESVW